MPATHSDIATLNIVRQWGHLKDVADEIHYSSDIEIGVLIEEMYLPLSNPWKLFMAKQTSLGQRNTNLDGESSVLSAWIKLNRKNVVAYQSIVLPFKGKELPDSCIPNVPQASHPLHQQDSVAVLVNKLQSKDVTGPRIIREIMELDYSELNYSRKICANERVESIKDKRFSRIITSGMHKNQLGNWEAPPPFKTDEVNLPDNRERCLRRLLPLKRKSCKEKRARENYIVFMKILERQYASGVPDNKVTPTPGKVWYL